MDLIKDAEFDFCDALPMQCHYCCNTISGCLAQCNEKGCLRYFCNNPTESVTQGSHIYNHLMISGHNKLSLDDGKAVECCLCGNNNCFLLYYQIVNNKILITCGEQCLLEKNNKRWLDLKPLFMENSFSSELLSKSNEFGFVFSNEISEIEAKTYRRPTYINKNQMKAVGRIKFNAGYEKSLYIRNNAMNYVIEGLCELKTLAVNEKIESIPGQPSLNKSQEAAVVKALSGELCIIQGPSGTGRTLTLATIAYNFCKLGTNNQDIELQQQTIVESSAKKIKNPFVTFAQRFRNLGSTNNNLNALRRENLDRERKKEVVLICATSDLCLLKIIRYLLKAKLNPLLFLKRNALACKNKYARINYRNIFFKELNKPMNKQVKVLYNARKAEKLKSIDHQILSRFTNSVNSAILEEVNIICYNILSGFTDCFNALTFSKVIIIETLNAINPEVLFPLLKKSKRVVLSTAQFDLSNKDEYKSAEEVGIHNSLFQRLLQLGHSPITLNTQYRMSVEIAKLPNFLMFNGIIKDENKVNHTIENLMGLKDLSFCDIRSEREMLHRENSYINKAEGQFIRKLIKNADKNIEIGVITFYESQRVLINKYLIGLRDKSKITVDLVEGFQGKSKDVIIVSCVRSNDDIGIGKVGNLNLLNIALTRAKNQLIICGNSLTLARSTVWRHMISYFHRNSLVRSEFSNSLKPILLDSELSDCFFTTEQQFELLHSNSSSGSQSSFELLSY